MSITCPQCSYVNPDQSTFCVRCGNALSASTQTGQIGQFAGGFRNPSGFTYTAPANPQPAYAPPPASNFPASHAQPVAQAWPAMASASSYPAPMGTTQGTISLRRAFAGHGIPVMHYSWLLDGKQVQTTAVSNAILEKINQRGIENLKITPEKLMERGIVVEDRDYIKIQRGVSTVFVYAAPAGRDLYVSRATTVLPTISNVRVIFYSLLVLFALLGPSVARGMLLSSSPDTGPTGYIVAGAISALVSVIAVPIWAFLIWLLIRSIIRWLFEKDFWWFLRPNTLNDFQLDDIALMEHVTDTVVYDAIKELGLDASKIIPPTQGYVPKRKVRSL